MLLLMGHVPFLWGPPDGYPDALSSWASSLIPRWQVASWMFDGLLPASFDLLGLLDAEGGDVPGEQAAAINQILAGGMLSGKEVTLLQDFFDDSSPPMLDALRDTFGLAASLPSSQWY